MLNWKGEENAYTLFYDITARLAIDRTGSGEQGHFLPAYVFPSETSF